MENQNQMTINDYHKMLDENFRNVSLLLNKGTDYNGNFLDVSPALERILSMKILLAEVSQQNLDGCFETDYTTEEENVTLELETEIQE